jgi:predicted transposase YbfD/YdcC
VRIVPLLQSQWPGLAQVLKLQRTTHRHGQETCEVQYAITSLSPQRADAAKLLALWRGHWGIENREHWIRDSHWREDRCRVRRSRGAHNLAAFRNAAINLLRLAKTPNLAAALRENAYRVERLFARLGILKL